MAANAGRGEDMVSRKDLATRLGVAVSTTYRWEANRAETGFPPPDSSGRWSSTQVMTWYANWVADKRAKFRPVDRGGDPEDLLDAEEVGKVLGSRAAKPAAVIRAYRSPRHGGYFPKPDATADSPGRRVPLWRRSTIWAFADHRQRHGGGRPGRSGRRPATTVHDVNDPATPTIPALSAPTQRSPDPTPPPKPACPWPRPTG